MNATAVSLLAIFEKKLRLEVPLFQRQYVWDREHQWEPLWEDISRKFTNYVENRKDGPVHFLGAMVLDQKQTPTTHVERRQVIDGQQRLTTFQLFLAAFRDFSREQRHEELAAEANRYIENPGMLADPKIDKFKVWPTNLDRTQFRDVVESNSRQGLEKRHPLVWAKYARHPKARPRMVEAYLYFYDELKLFFLGTATDKPVAFERPVNDRLGDCFSALQNALRVVVIDLDSGDDAQVIFETLNARGQPLLPSDLLRNFIFLRAARKAEPQELLYEEFWRPFDDPFWRTEEVQGRLRRPRSDLFLQHYLTFRRRAEIPITHLFVEYKHWIDKSRPFESVRDELADLALHRENYRRLVSPDEKTLVGRFARFLQIFEVKTVYPLLLGLFHAALTTEDLDGCCEDLESYLVRRAVCNLPAKNYNRVFLSLLSRFSKGDPTRANFRRLLADQVGESSLWPDDSLFNDSWLRAPAYWRLQPSARITYLLRRINERSFGARAEDIKVGGALTVEHIMPQGWIEHWPLPDGTKGMTTLERYSAQPTDPRPKASILRDGIVQTIGNLTLVTLPLNSSLSNSAFSVKRGELLKQSYLPLNHQLQDYPTWDEVTIVERGGKLFETAKSIWASPPLRLATK